MESLPWSALTKAAPALAEFGERRMATAPSYLATVRGKGLPRVHPVSPQVRSGHLCVYMYPTSPKGKDLRLDGRYALHTSVPDNDGSGGEFHLRGHGRQVEDPTTVGFPAREGYVLFELLLDEATAVNYPDEGPPDRQSWRRTT
jgi:hypothetical protein